MNFLSKINRFITGYDFFVSYSRNDAAKYATALGVELIRKGYTCYLDQWGALPGTDIPKNILRKLSKSSVLIILGSESAATSEAVTKEVQLFIKTKRSIIPVDLGGIDNANWFALIEGLAISKEEPRNLVTSQPSDRVVVRIENSLKYTKQTLRIKRSIITAIFIILAAIGGIVISTKTLFNAREKLGTIETQLDTISKESKSKSLELAKKVKDLDQMQDSLKIKQQEIKKATIELANLDLEKEKIEDLAKLRESNAKDMFNRFVEINQKAYIQPTYSNCDSIFHYQKLIIFFDFDKTTIPKKYDALLTKLSTCLIDRDDYILEARGYVGKTYINKEEFERIESNTAEGEEVIGAASLTYPYNAVYSMSVAERLAQNVASSILALGVNPQNVVNGAHFSEGRMFLDTQVFDLMGSRVELLILKVQ